MTKRTYNNKNEQLNLFDGWEELNVLQPRPTIITPKKDDHWRRLKERNFGFEYCKSAIFSGKYGFPTIKAYKGEIPEQIVTISNIGITHSANCCLAGFDYDYILERLWYNFNHYESYIKSYACVAELDFSLYIDTPQALQIANIWRSHVMAYAIQEIGVPILPAPTWGAKPSFEYCFDGHEKGGAVLVSTIGTLNNECSRSYFKEGFMEMLNRIDPELVILYGDTPDSLLSWLPKQLSIKIINHYRFERARYYGR